MNQGFFRCAAMTPKIKVADCEYNSSRICELIDEAGRRQAGLLVLPELCITGYTCNDLFFQVLYSGKKGYHSSWAKRFFYIFYPAHLALLLVISVMLPRI